MDEGVGGREYSGHQTLYSTQTGSFSDKSGSAGVGATISGGDQFSWSSAGRAYREWFRREGRFDGWFAGSFGGGSGSPGSLPEIPAWIPVAPGLAPEILFLLLFHASCLGVLVPGVFLSSPIGVMVMGLVIALTLVSSRIPFSSQPKEGEI